MAAVRRQVAKRAKAPKRAKPTRKSQSTDVQSVRPKSGKSKSGKPKIGKRKADKPKPETARLKALLRDARDREAATADILKVIASSRSDAQPVFEAIATSANRLVGGFATAVFRLLDDTVHLTAFTPVSPAADAALKADFPRPVHAFEAFRLAQHGKPFPIPDTENIPHAPIREIARLQGFRSMLFVPLMNAGVAIGIISVTRVKPGSFADHHVQLLQTFADQAVIAIENVRLFDEVQAKTRDLGESLQQQTATAEVLKVISRSAFDLQIVLDTLVESAAQLCEAHEGIILQPKADGFGLTADWGLTPAKKEFITSRIFRPDDSGLASRILTGSNVVHIRDVLQEPEFNPRGDPNPARTRLYVPLLRNSSPIGVFVLTRQVVQPFTAKQIELVSTFSDQAVIAIENARLFDEVQQRTRELSQSLEDLRAAQDRLVQTEKLASLGQLTAGIAHEIKNPLNFVNNFAALSVELTDELDDVLKRATLADNIRVETNELTRVIKDNLGKIVQHGKRADSIVKNMLLHSREGSGERRPSDVNALLDESLNLAYHGARAEKSGFNITLVRDFDPLTGVADLYPQEITRVLLNLISNGFYAATKHAAETGDGFEPILRAATRNLGDKIEIRIRDNGTGIAPEIKEKIFNPFFTTKPAGEGTGLGLSMSHDIVVKQHNGAINVDTEPGVFTEFIITLPRAIVSQKTAAVAI